MTEAREMHESIGTLRIWIVSTKPSYLVGSKSIKSFDDGKQEPQYGSLASALTSFNYGFYPR